MPMHSSVAGVHGLVSGIQPWDGVEERHRAQVLRWLESTDDVYRRRRPDVPDPHLVSYVALVAADAVLLVDHVAAGLWLPPGGHVEPGEHPADTALREAHEELGVRGVFTSDPPAPAFVTVTRTVGAGSHVDVSLWFLLRGDRSMPLAPDPAEIRGTRWWTFAQVQAADPSTLDPHLGRFAAKVAAGQQGR
jgi:8-oxo-dGTP pyrophosphatase MutT (NUDIX family)